MTWREWPPVARKKRKSAAARHAAVRASMDYEGLFKAQGGRCALCGAKPGTRGLYRDHDHARLKPRGLLCYRDNKFIPHWATLEWARQLVRYLESYAEEGNDTPGQTRDDAPLRPDRTSEDDSGGLDQKL